MNVYFLSGSVSVEILTKLFTKFPIEDIPFSIINLCSPLKTNTYISKAKNNTTDMLANLANPFIPINATIV